VRAGVHRGASYRAVTDLKISCGQYRHRKTDHDTLSGWIAYRHRQPSASMPTIAPNRVTTPREPVGTPLCGF